MPELERFVAAQEQTYSRALAELRDGEKLPEILQGA